MNSNYVYNDPLAVIYNEGHWRLNKMSPMHNLQYDTVKLKLYALKIRQAFVGNIATNSILKIEVVFEELPTLKYSEDDSNALKITVASKSLENPSLIKKTLYCAILISWGVSITLDDAIHLPYMLEVGEQKVGTVVKSTLQTLFDCNIKQYHFTQQQLLLFCFNFVENDNSKSTDAFVLSYKMPNSSLKDKFSLSFEIGDIHTIWNGVKNEIENEYESTTFAYQLLQKQIHNMITLDITVFDLCNVILPKAEVRNNGIVKMKTPELVNSVFSVLNKITSSLYLDIN